LRSPPPLLNPTPLSDSIKLIGKDLSCSEPSVFFSKSVLTPLLRSSREKSCSFSLLTSPLLIVPLRIVSSFLSVVPYRIARALRKSSLLGRRLRTFPERIYPPLEFPPLSFSDRAARVPTGRGAGLLDPPPAPLYPTFSSLVEVKDFS